jgi:uncharacterized membrane protein
MKTIKNTNEYLELFSSKGKFEMDKKHLKAYEMAIDTRKFEIELYWKRTAYFWAFIVTTFAGYGWTLKSSSGFDDNFLTLLISCFGLILSVSWFLANKGSKKWQENWENHIDLLEDEITGPLYKTVLERKESNFFTGSENHSVSKINQLISVFVTVIWFILICKSIYNIYEFSFSGVKLWSLVLIILTIIAIIALFFKTTSTPSKINYHTATIRKSEIVE